jgi:hypothetical protein
MAMPDDTSFFMFNLASENNAYGLDNGDLFGDFNMVTEPCDFASATQHPEAQQPDVQLPTPDSIGPSSGDSLFSVSSGSESSDDCFRLATESLASLYRLPVSSASGQADCKPPSVDQVLQHSASALRNLEKLLSCACLKDFYIPIIIAILASKALSWYQAVVSVQDPHTELPGGRGCARESVTDRPLALGSYVPDDETGWAVKHQLVLRQLHKMSELVTQYQAKFGSPAGSPESGAGGEGARLYHTMCNFLDVRLQLTISEVENRLGGSP